MLGYYVTTTVDHTLHAIQSNGTSADVAWSFFAWSDDVGNDIAYERTILSGIVYGGFGDETNVVMVLRGSYFYAFDLTTGDVLVAAQNLTCEGELPLSLQAITPANDFFLVQYNNWVTVVNALGALAWAQPVRAGFDIRTGTSDNQFYVALVQTVYNDTHGRDFGVTVLSAIDGSIIYRSTYKSYELVSFYFMVVESNSVTYYLQRQNQPQMVYRYDFDGREIFAMKVPVSFQGYGIYGDVMYLQVGNAIGGLTVDVFNYSTGELVASSGPVPASVVGKGHLMAEPGFGILTFVQNSTLFHLTAWRASDATILYNYSFKDPIAPHGSRASANMMMANWNGRAFVPSTTGFSLIDGNRPAAPLDDRYQDAFPNIVFTATALTERVLVVTCGANVTAFEIL